MNQAIKEFGIGDITSINEALLSVGRMEAQAYSEIDYCNKRQEDLLHELELKKLGNREMTKLAKELRDVRRRRRNAKNHAQLLGPISTWISQNQNAVNKLSQVIGQIKRIEKNQNEAIYTSKADDGASVIEHYAEDDIL